MPVQVRAILEKFPDLIRLSKGSESSSIESLKDPTQAGPSDLIFVANAERFKAALNTKARHWLAHSTLVPKIPATVETLLVSDNVALCMALIGQTFFPITRNRQAIEGPNIHPSATVSKTAQIGSGCIIGPSAVIGDGCKIGANTVIGANAVIEPGVEIGEKCHIHPLVFVGHACVIGHRCEIHPNTTIGSEGFGYAQDKQVNHYRIPHYGRVVLEDDVHIGAGVQIDRGTFLDSRIGQGTKIDNHCHFGHNIQIGRGTIITGGVITAGSVTLGSYCVVGGRSTFAGHIQVADRVQIGGLSGVSSSVDKPGMYAGFPLQDLKSDMRTRASFKKLPLLIRQMRTVMKHLGLKDEGSEELP